MSVLGPEVEWDVFVLDAVCGAVWGASGRGGGVDCHAFDLDFDMCVVSDLEFIAVLRASGLGGGVEWWWCCVGGLGLGGFADDGCGVLDLGVGVFCGASGLDGGGTLCTISESDVFPCGLSSF